MKTSLKLFLAAHSVADSGAFAQEPKQALAKQVSSGGNKKEMLSPAELPYPLLQSFNPKHCRP